MMNTSVISYFLLIDGRNCIIEGMELSHLHANFVAAWLNQSPKFEGFAYYNEYNSFLTPIWPSPPSETDNQIVIKFPTAYKTQTSLPCSYKRIPALFREARPIETLCPFTLCYGLSWTISCSPKWSPTFRYSNQNFVHICYFLIRPTWPASPSWFVVQDYKLRSLPPPQRLHVCFTKCSKTTIYWENASTCANRGKQRVLGTPFVTYLHFYAYFIIRTDIHQEIMYWSLVLKNSHNCN
jgi:hypothetical protein